MKYRHLGANFDILTMLRHVTLTGDSEAKKAAENVKKVLSSERSCHDDLLNKFF